MLACLCPVLTFGQTDTRIGTAAPNFSSFSTKKVSNSEAWKKFNRPAHYKHPEFGILPEGSPAGCVELLDRRKADERVFRSLSDPSEIFIQKSLGDLHRLKDGQWLTIDDKLHAVAPGHYLSGSYPEPVGIDVPEKRSFIHTPQGKVYFNSWVLYARTGAGEVQLDQADWSHYSAGADGLLIHDIFKGIDAELRVYRGTIKTSFIIKRNAYGLFDQLIFRDRYQTPTTAKVSFAGGITGPSAVGKLEIYSGNTAVLKVNEAVIYPKGAGKEEVITTPYAIKDNTMDVLVPYSWISTHLDGHELVIDPTVTGSATIAAAAITGSRYNASCSFDSSCNYTMSVAIPPGTTVTGALYSFTYLATAPCFGSDGAVRFRTGNCTTGYFTNQSQTSGPTIMNLVPITNDIQACFPAPSCTPQNMDFTMQFFRSCKGATGCDNNCIGASAPWVMTIRAKTVEFNDPVEPISYTANNICMGDSIYVSTWASYGVPPYNYNWSFNASGTPSLGTGASTSITFPNILNHTIYAIITDACGNATVDSLPVTVNYAAVTATPISDTLCSGETTAIQLTAPIAGTTFSWTVQQNGAYGASAGSGNTIAQILTTTGGTPGTVTYTITPHNGGCDGTPATVTIRVNPPITVFDNRTVCVNQLPFGWNNQLIYGGGAYIASHTVPSLVTGCDSTTILNLTVNAVPVVTVDRTICASQLPYAWNGLSVTTGGNGAATFTATGANSCDSITSLNLHVVNTLTATVTATVCAAQLPYVWNGINVNAGGPAAATYTSTSAVSGCDSTTTLSLTVNPLPRDTISIAICANQLPLSWNGQTINSGGTAVATFTTPSLLTGCDSTTTLNLVVHQPVQVTVNRSICSGQLPYAWNGQTINAGGTATASFTTPSLLTGCDSTTILNLTVNPSPSVIRSVTICAGQMPYTWNGITVTAGGPSAAVFTTPSAATGCDSTTTLNLTVNPVLTAMVNRTVCAGQMPYSWNGITVTAGGTAAAVFTTASAQTGCDSTTTLNLTVNPVLTATVSRTICSGQLPYSWNGLSVAAGGANAATYTTTSASSGCDSTTTLNLTVNPVLTATISRTICASQLPYSWNGLSVAAGGGAAATFTTASSVSGCDSTTTLNLTVNPLIQVTKNVSICTVQLPYSWNGHIITAGGPAVASYTTASLLTGCDSTTTLNLQVNPVINATRNQTICAGQLPYTWNGIVVNTGGTAVATYTTTSMVSGCDSITTLNLNINPVLTTVRNITICSGQLPYHWNGITVTAAGSGVAVYTVSSAITGCDSSTILNLAVVPAIRDTVYLTLCANQLPYIWNGVSVTAGGSQAAQYTTMATGGCDSITTLNLTIKQVYTATIDTSICYAQAPFHWLGQSYASSGSYPHPFTSVAGCDSIITLSLHISPTPVTLLPRDSAGCGQVHFKGILYTSNTTVKDTLLSARGCDSAYRTTNIRILTTYRDTLKAGICANQTYTWMGETYKESGLYTRSFNMPSGCDSVLNLELTVWDIGQAVIVRNLDETPCVNDTITVTAQGAQDYDWKWNDQDLGNDAQQHIVLSEKVNVIRLLAKDEHACESEAKVSIETKACCEMMIPNAFSPNGDGLNDRFGPETIGNPKDFKMMIFNRYGQLLFTSISVNSKWDGTYQGKPVDIGTYFFRVYTKCTNDTENTFKGDITLIR